MKNTVIGVYDSYSQARNAMEELIASGFDQTNIRMNPDQEMPTHDMNARDDEQEHRSSTGGIGHFFRSLFGMDEKHEHRSIYSEAVRRGSCLLSVDTNTEEECDRASEIMHRYDAVDIDERSRTWKDEGWSASNMDASTQTLNEIDLTNQHMAGTSTHRPPATTRMNSQNVNVFPRTQDTSASDAFEPAAFSGTTSHDHMSPIDRPQDEGMQAIQKDETENMAKFDSYHRTEKDPVIVSSLIVEDLIVNRDDFTKDASRMEVHQADPSYDINAKNNPAENSAMHERRELFHPLRQEGDSFIDDSHAPKLDNTENDIKAARLEDDYDFRNHWQTSYAQEGGRYEDYDEAYRYGSSISGSSSMGSRDWKELEPDVRSDWEMRHPESTWDRVKDAVRYGAERMKANTRH